MRRERGEERRSKPLRLPPDHALMTRGPSIRPSLPRRSAQRESGLRNSQNSCLMARVIVAVLLNALVPGAGHATLGRYGAAVGWFVGTVTVWGSDDRLLPPDMGRAVAEALDAPIHLVPNADHDWPVLRPDLFAREVDLLLRGALADEPKRIRRRRPKRA